MIPYLRHAAHILNAKFWKPFGEPATYAIWHAILHYPRITASITAAILVLTIAAWWLIRSRRPSTVELERRRREYLTTHGRITDGLILDARTLDGRDSFPTENASLEHAPEVLVYSYRLAGVTYHCAQDVSMLPEQVRGYRLDQPISLRYDPRHPGNSILVSETWSGLWQHHR